MKRPWMQWPIAHGVGKCLCSTTLVWMTDICCPMSLGLFKDSWETQWGVWVNATLGNVLQMLDKHYGAVMTFDALSKKLYSLKQRMGENVAEFRVHLSQQVQILQMEYPSRIQQEHVEEMKWDHFYEGLSPEYQQMLAHKFDGGNPVAYSELLLAAQKLKRQTESRDSLVLNTTTARGWAASVQVTMATAVVTAVCRLWSGVASSFSVFPVVSRAWSDVADSVCLVVLCLCSWRGYPVREVYVNMSVFITFMTSDMWAVSCNMPWYLALETLVFLTWHHVDCGIWNNSCSKLLYCIEFLYFCDGIH